ncbi:unnamed protein product [Medioppia subpectinata]|uniref:2Fe-2S ferredoxin-type domain-containing protein n=1 Tax=Medioppia subpectinata TaxID=1979941 RepID=A0A7R9KWL6_9ACAR|nr:unnamed protein product [Medioppia subpectinata]CAG2109877.1 unnamed protein product [Medioppia subpectinata]
MYCVVNSLRRHCYRSVAHRFRHCHRWRTSLPLVIDRTIITAGRWMCSSTSTSNTSNNQRVVTISNSQTISADNKPKKSADKTKANISVTFVTTDGRRLTGAGKEGDSLLDVVVDNELDLDGFGACEGTLACSTCHLIFEKKDFDQINNKATDEELDMLDLAFGLCDTSRLGCQIILTPWMNGLEIKVPDSVNDVRTT